MKRNEVEWNRTRPDGPAKDQDTWRNNVTGLSLMSYLLFVFGVVFVIFLIVELFRFLSRGFDDSDWQWWKRSISAPIGLLWWACRLSVCGSCRLFWLLFLAVCWTSSWHQSNLWILRCIWQSRSNFFPVRLLPYAICLAEQRFPLLQRLLGSCGKIYRIKSNILCKLMWTSITDHV